MANRVSRHNALALAAILAVALNLRIGVTEVGPLLDRIRAATGMSATVAGALGTIPFACMGVFALVGVRLVVRVRARWLVTACLVLLIAGTVGRAAAPSAALVLLATIPVGIAIALIGLVLPVVVRGCFPRRTGAAMGTYVAALSVGAALAALTMVPLANDLAGWRAAFAISALPTLLSLPLWLLLAPRATGRQPATMPNETVVPASRDARPGESAPPAPAAAKRGPARRRVRVSVDVLRGGDNLDRGHVSPRRLELGRGGVHHCARIDPGDPGCARGPGALRPRRSTQMGADDGADHGRRDGRVRVCADRIAVALDPRVRGRQRGAVPVDVDACPRRSPATTAVEPS